MSIVLVLVAFALLMAHPGVPRPRGGDRGRRSLPAGGSGALGLRARRSHRPRAERGLYLLGVAMLVRVESRLLALAALVAGVGAVARSSSAALTGGEQMAACTNTEPSRCSSASSRQGLMLDLHHG